jgi:hypothetical protein
MQWNMRALLGLVIVVLIAMLGSVVLNWQTISYVYVAPQPSEAAAVTACREFALRKIDVPTTRIRLPVNPSPQERTHLGDHRYRIIDVIEVLHKQGITEYKIYSCTTRWSNGAYNVEAFQFVTQ